MVIKSDQVAPVLKWVGGKRQLLGALGPLIPKRFSHYCEPFFGGGAVLFALQPNKAIVNDLKGEKIDIINWSDDPEVLIENALSPSKVIAVSVNEEEKTARVVVPDYQLSLAIGKEGQNARLAARLTGYKIDIKSESQANVEYDDFGDLDVEEEYSEQDENQEIVLDEE